MHCSIIPEVRYIELDSIHHHAWAFTKPVIYDIWLPRIQQETVYLPASCTWITDFEINSLIYNGTENIGSDLKIILKLITEKNC